MASHSSAVVRRSASRSKARESARAGSLRPGHPAVLVAATTGALVLIGLLMILSASSVESFATYGTSFVYFKKQLIWAAVGIVGFVVFAFVDYRRWRNLGYLAFAVTLVLLLAVIIPGVGVTVGGSARWLAFGPLQFQPSELAKLALILFLADVFSRKREELFDTFAHTMMPLIPALAILGLFIMKQPDLGTTMILGLIGMGMVFVAGGPVRYIAPTMAVGGLLATALALAEPYRRARRVDLPPPVPRSVQHRDADRAVVDRGGIRRMVRSGSRSQPSEVVTHPERAHRLHLCDLRRGDGTVRLGADDRSIHVPCLSRRAHGS